MKRLAGYTLMSVPVWALLGLGFALEGWSGLLRMAVIGAFFGVLGVCVVAGVLLSVEGERERRER